MKLTTLATHLSPIIPLLRCPKCGSTVTLEQDRSLVCENRHCYDLSAKGYANLAPSRDQNTDKYNAALFESRSAIFNAGFYAPIAQALCAAVKRHHTGVQRSYKTIQPSVTPDASASFTSPIVLDAGCGEGYYTRALCDAIPNATVIGGDLSRDAIIAAARQAHETPWLVADLTRLPLADGCIDALIDVLTPADYREFARVLHPDGLLYKVIPADDYLTEIRSAIASHLADANFSNARVLEHLRAHADIVEQETIRHTLPVTPTQAAHFVRMTPMTFGLSEDILQDIQISHITIAMTLLICKPKRD